MRIQSGDVNSVTGGRYRELASILTQMAQNQVKIDV
jgi:hypothetical protein